MYKIQNLFVIVPAMVMFWSSSALSDARFRAHQFKPQVAVNWGAQQVQFTIELGNSSGNVRELLESQGYSEIQITKSSFTSVRAQACFQGSRYLVKVKTIGARISRLAKIGECQPIFSPTDIVNQLAANGYSRISLDIVEGDTFEVRACRGGDRMKLRANRYGKIVEQVRLGRCREILDAAEVKQRLREDNYDRIKLVKESSRQYKFEACRGRKLVSLQIRKDGTVRRQSAIGNCAPPIELWQLKSIVEKRGYNRVIIVDRKLPGYGVEACRGRKLMQLKVDRYGEIRKTNRIGECEPAFNKKTLDAHLRDRGANRIVVTAQGSDGFITQSCYRKQKFRTEFDLYGTVQDRRRIGECAPPPRLTEVVKQFEKQDVFNPNLLVEGCRSGRLYRYRINTFGEIISSKRLGKC